MFVQLEDHTFHPHMLLDFISNPVDVEVSDMEYCPVAT